MITLVGAIATISFLACLIIFYIRSEDNRKANQKLKKYAEIIGTLENNLLDLGMNIEALQKKIADLENLWLETQEPITGPIEFPYVEETAMPTQESMALSVPTQESVAVPVPEPSEREQVLALLAEGPKTKEEIAAYLKVAPDTAYEVLARLRKKNLVTKVNEKWQILKEPSPVIDTAKLDTEGKEVKERKDVT